LDFGYWYCPDGRSAPQQRAFEQVEVKPQALEWIFSVASGRRFRVSADNLAGDPGDIQGFERAVHQEVLRRLDVGLPQRAAQFTQALLAQFAPGLVLGAALFDRDVLR
jgi:elongation factor P hydroxylase